MLVNLDNEVHFKKVFTDTEVFRGFAKDVTGIDLAIDKVETEKVLSSPVGAIKFRMDLYAEDEEKRAVVEIQKVDYDYNYDRFTHYFSANLIDVQRSSKDYSYAKEVYLIVVVTEAYRIRELDGQPVKDGVLITDINPRTIQGEERQMTNHKMMILNTEHVDENTPQEIRDWMDLIRESMHNPANPRINRANPFIAKAAMLAELDGLDPEQLAEAKIHEMRKKTIAIIEETAREKARKEAEIETQEEMTRKGILKALERGKLTDEEIAEDFEVSIEYVKELRKNRLV